jgi:DNA-directed RNA polymerase specialized sigma24 family protein
VSEADDAVQEAWLRLSRTDAREVENLGAWLTTVVGGVSLNMLRSLRTHREVPLEGRVPEPIVDRVHGTDPGTRRSWPTSSASRCSWSSRR